MMEDFRWEGTKSVKWLMERWQLSETCIRTYASEASRYFTADASEARRDISQGCRQLFLQAVEKGDAKGAKFAGELWAKVAGADVQQVNHTIELSDKTPALARQTMAELFGSVGANKQLTTTVDVISETPVNVTSDVTDDAD